VKCGYIAIAGLSNAGKSTLLNKILRFKLAITSPKPQTTRNRILGVHTEAGTQIIFLDAPGLHQGRGALNKLMLDVALKTLNEADGILFVVDACDKRLDLAQKAAAVIAGSGKPALLALNKIDAFNDKSKLLPLIEKTRGWHDWRALAPVSARNGDGLPQLLAKIREILPPGPPVFPEDAVTDLSARFLAAEIVREKVFRLTQEDIPYAVAVTIDEFTPPGHRRAHTCVRAVIHVPKDGQKAIIIGKGGGMLKNIGAAARRDLEKMLDSPVFLQLFVRVTPQWNRDGQGLRKMGY
jgi:GTP-binding protein Era